MSVSGVLRGEQRRLYDQRRRQILAGHGITLIEVSFSEFQHGRRKRLRRNLDEDERALRHRLAAAGVCAAPAPNHE